MLESLDDALCTMYYHKISHYSIMAVRTAIIIIPDANESICLSDSLGFSSCKSSGRTVTKAICRNPPAVNGKIQEVRASATDIRKIHQQEIQDINKT